MLGMFSICLRRISKWAKMKVFQAVWNKCWKWDLDNWDNCWHDRVGGVTWFYNQIPEKHGGSFIVVYDVSSTSQNHIDFLRQNAKTPRFIWHVTQTCKDRQGVSAWSSICISILRPYARIPCLRVAQRRLERLRFATVESHIGTVCWRPDMLRQSEQAGTPPSGQSLQWCVICLCGESSEKNLNLTGVFAGGGGGDTVSPKWIDCSIHWGVSRWIQFMSSCTQHIL